MTQATRESTIADALDAISWRTLGKEEMVAFILGAVEQAERAGRQQAADPALLADIGNAVRALGG